MRNGLNEAIFYQVGEKNSFRYKSYKPIGLRFSKHWDGRKKKLEVYLNLLDLLNTNNIRNFYCSGFTNNAGVVNVNRNENSFSPFFVMPGLKHTLQEAPIKSNMAVL